MNFADRVKETTTTAGTGDITLSGVAESSFNTLSDSFSVGDRIPYCVVDQSGGDWEVGQGTLTSATTLARSTVTASSNAGLLVSFGSGTKYVFCTLSADLLKKISRATSSNVFYLTKNGATDDANLAQFSTTFGTDSTAAIQSVLDQASASTPIEVVFDGKFSVTGLRVKGYTTITALPGCGAILRTSSAKSLLENYNLSFAAGVRTDKNIKIRGGIWNGNAGTANANNTKGNGTVGLVCAMRFYGVEDLDIVPEAITNSPSYAIHTLNCARYSVSRGITDCGVGGVINMDGIHADGNCEDITFRDMVITAHDDAIGFNADDLYRDPGNFTYPYYPAIASGSIKNALIENILLKSQLFGLRVLSGASRVDNLVYKNIKGATTGLAMIVDNYRQSPSILSAAGAGNIGTLEIDGMDVAITAIGPVYAYNCTININCNVDKVVIKRLTRNDFHFARPTILISGAGTVIKSLVIEGYDSLDASSAHVTPHIQIDAATVNHLKISGATVKRAGASNASSLLSLTSSAVVGTLQLDNISLDALDNLLLNTSGTISRISASNIVHLNETSGEATFDTTSTIPRINLSGYIGTLATSGTFSTTSGDGFAAVVDTTAPTLVSAVVENGAATIVKLTMSEAINPSFVPAASAFTVSGHTVASVAISGNIINVTCSDAFVNGEAARTLAYAQPGTNNIRDTSGNLLVNFSGASITNSVATTGGPAYVTLAGDAYLVDNGTTKSLTGSATTDNTYHRYLGATGTAKLSAGVDGYVYMKLLSVESSGGQLDSTIGFNTANSTAQHNIGLVFSSTKVLSVVNGVGSVVQDVALGYNYRIARTGSTLTLDKSPDAISWTNVYTFALSTTAEIYVFGFMANTGTIPNMTGVGLS